MIDHLKNHDVSGNGRKLRDPEITSGDSRKPKHQMLHIGPITFGVQNLRIIYEQLISDVFWKRTCIFGKIA